MEVEGVGVSTPVAHAGIEACIVGMRSVGKPGPLAHSLTPLRRVVWGMGGYRFQCLE